MKNFAINKRNPANTLLFVGLAFLVFSFVYNLFLTPQYSVNQSNKILTNWIDRNNTFVEDLLQQPEIHQDLDSIPQLFNYLDALEKSDYLQFYVTNSDNQLVYWSTDKVIPNNINLSVFGKEQRLVKMNNAYHLIQVYPLEKGFHLISLLTVYQSFPVENKYLSSGFVLGNSVLKMTKITRRDDLPELYSTPVLSKQGKTLFYVKENPSAGRLVLWPIVVLEIAGVFLLFLFVSRKLKIALRKNKLKEAVLLTVAYAAFIEIYINILHVPSFTYEGNLFKLDSYASPFLADSLGELFLRIHLLHWVFRNWFSYYFQHTSFKNSKVRSIILSFYFVFSYYITVYLISSLHHNSIISFDLYRFDQLDINSLLGVIIISFSFGIMYVPFKYLKTEYFDKKVYASQLLFHFVFVGLGCLFGIFDSYKLVVGLVLVFQLYLRVVEWLILKQEKHQYPKMYANLILLTMYSFVGASCILYYSNIRKIEVVQHYAMALASERDYAEEFDIANIVDVIRQDNFIKIYFENPYLTSFDVEKRIQQRYFAKYLGKYNISIHTFNNEGIQLKGEGTKTFYTLRLNRNQKGVQEISPFFYYLSVKPRGEKYMAFIDFKNQDALFGYLVIVFTPKTFTPYSAYPELLKSENDYSIYNNVSNISYAIYRNKNLMSVSGNYSYPAIFNFPLPASGKFSIQKNRNNIQVIYRMAEKQVVVTYDRLGFLSSFSFYSYLLIVQIIFFYILSFLSGSGGFSQKGRGFLESIKMDTLQKQIQSSMVSQVLFSLVLIGAMTVFFFNVQYNHLHNESLKQRGLSVVDAIEIMYAESFEEDHEDVFNKILKNKMKQLSEIFAIDMNAFDVNGKLLYSSQPEIFKGGLQSNLMHPQVYKALKIDRYSSFIHEERIGKLDFIAAYLPVKDPNGNIVGYINFPYYGKELNIKNDISFFLMSLVNIYVLLILGASLISIWVSKEIVKPLSIITENIKGVELGKYNRHIEWKNKDEIGQLVNEYNRMIDVLGESARLLAKSEREGAWREMAKQVAHEIKNPLTPMKLSIQHLQRALSEHREDTEEMTRKIASRLIEQIDTLSNIASAFSNFAKMPLGHPKNEDVVQILKSVVDLFIVSNEVKIVTEIPDKEILVFVDKDQMVRVFTNLIKNAIQSIPNLNHGLVEIIVEEKDSFCNIIVKDNGIGIPPEKAKDIFEPNFTTKTSGTGLGLAMSKSIIENAGGEIGFVSNGENQGTSFFIRLNTV